MLLFVTGSGPLMVAKAGSVGHHPLFQFTLQNPVPPLFVQIYHSNLIKLYISKVDKWFKTLRFYSGHGGKRILHIWSTHMSLNGGFIYQDQIEKSQRFPMFTFTA